MKKLLFLFIIIFSSLFILVGCKDDKPSPDVTVESIKFVDDVSMFNLDVDSFLLEDIEIIVKYSDKTSEIIPLTRDMLTKADFEQLLTTGTYFIKIKYSNLELEATIQMTKSSGTLKILPQICIYYLKSKEAGKTIYDVYTTSVGNYVSYYLELYHFSDVNSITIINNEGVFDYNIDNDFIKIIHSFGKNILGETFLFRVIIEEEDASLYFSNTKLNFYGFNDEVYQIKDVKYYYR